jgi:O-antigen ligase
MSFFDLDDGSHPGLVQGGAANYPAAAPIAPATAFLNSALLVSATAYLALLPSNAATFARSLSFGIAAAIAFAALVGSLIGRNERTPSPGTPILVCLALWSAWSVASLGWSVNPDYSAEQLKREVGWSLLTVLIFYMAARTTYAWRVMVRTALIAFAVYAALALAMAASAQGWDPSRFHSGVGPYSTQVVLIAPFLLALLAPLPTGFGGRRRAFTIGLVLLALLVASARLTENRMLWIALAATFATASVVAGLRWRGSLTRLRLRWIVPMLLLLVVLTALFLDAAHERASADFPPQTSIAQTLSQDPRIPLWDHAVGKAMTRPWVGFGFGRAILADKLKDEMHNPVLWHAHNVFVSQWLQTGAIGMLLFAALLTAVLARFIAFIRATDDGVAFVGVIGITLIVGFVVKNLTDDFLFRSNAREFWALLALLLGYGIRAQAALQSAHAARATQVH